MITVQHLLDGMDGRPDGDKYYLGLEFDITNAEMRARLEAARPTDYLRMQIGRKGRILPGVTEIVEQFGGDDE